jgi:hypothetical protein
MKRFLVQFIGGAVGGGGAALGILFLIRLPRFDLGGGEIALLLLALIPMAFLVFGLHELGHLLGGAAVRFRPYLYIVGPLKLERVHSRGWTVGLNRCAPLFGGLAAGIPDSVEDLQRRITVLIASGPGANLLCGSIALAGLVAVRPPAGARVTLSGGDAVLYLLLLMFCTLSFFVAYVALLPATSNGYSSDGLQIYRYLTKHEQMDGEVALTTVSLASLAGQRPRDADPDLIARALTLPANSSRGALARYVAHVHALDKGDIAWARTLIAEAIDHRQHVQLMSRPAVLLQAAQFAALHDGDAEAARRYLDEAGQGALLGPEARLFAEAAVLHVEGKPGVEALLDKAEAALPDAMDRGGAQMLGDEIAALRRATRS